jgi:hypothetical protein
MPTNVKIWNIAIAVSFDEAHCIYRLLLNLPFAYWISSYPKLAFAVTSHFARSISFSLFRLRSSGVRKIFNLGRLKFVGRTIKTGWFGRGILHQANFKTRGSGMPFSALWVAKLENLYSKNVEKSCFTFGFLLI